MKVTVIGLGFVGSSLSSFLASKNIHVIRIDSDKEKNPNILKYLVILNFYVRD